MVPKISLIASPKIYRQYKAYAVGVVTLIKVKYSCRKKKKEKIITSDYCPERSLVLILFCGNYTFALPTKK